MDRRNRYPKAFEREARAYLADRPWCAYCAEAGRSARATLVDHIRPIARGGSIMARANWAACCSHCHNGWIQKLERGGAYRPAHAIDGSIILPGPVTARAIAEKATLARHQEWTRHIAQWRGFPCAAQPASAPVLPLQEGAGGGGVCRSRRDGETLRGLGPAEINSGHS
jgi:hypothetical protein